MKVLITGGAGYIGSHAVKQFLAHGDEVVVVDNLSTGHLDAVDERATFYQGDIADYDFMDGVLKKEQIETVIHFAAFSLVGESMTNPFKYYENNVSKSNVLLKVLADNNIKKLVFSSTAATYGEPKRVPIQEEDETLPTNVYGETKKAIEQMIKWYANAYQMKYVILRYFNVAGASIDSTVGERHNPETHLIPIVLQVASNKRPKLSVFGNDYPTNDGTCIRDYIHVVDLCEAHYLATRYLENNQSDIFNLGSGAGFSVLEIIEAAREVTNHPIPIEISPRREGDPAVLIASSAKARRILNWNPQYENIKKMISDAWNYEQKR